MAEQTATTAGEGWTPRLLLEQARNAAPMQCCADGLLLLTVRAGCLPAGELSAAETIRVRLQGGRAEALPLWNVALGVAWRLAMGLPLLEEPNPRQCGG